jgi:hypothetical protein
VPLKSERERERERDIMPTYGAFTLDVKSVLNGKSRWHPRWHPMFKWAIA